MTREEAGILKLPNRKPFKSECVKLDKDGWPIELILPSEEDFTRGTWIENNRVLGSLGELDECSEFALLPEKYVNHCNTRCCLVGWTGAAFGGPWCPTMSVDYCMTKAQRAFLIQFLRFAGASESSEKFKRFNTLRPVSLSHRRLDDFSDYGLLTYASDVFEGEESPSGRVRGRLTAKKAAMVWLKTAEHFGYDVQGAKIVRRTS